MHTYPRSFFGDAFRRARGAATATVDAFAWRRLDIVIIIRHASKTVRTAAATVKLLLNKKEKKELFKLTPYYVIKRC